MGHRKRELEQEGKNGDREISRVGGQEREQEKKK
jgi:hypothetical protein